MGWMINWQQLVVEGGREEKKLGLTLNLLRQYLSSFSSFDLVASSAFLYVLEVKGYLITSIVN